MIALVLLLLGEQAALAHDFTPGVLALQETAPRTFQFSWTAPVDSGSTVPVALRFPDHCDHSTAALRCERGLDEIAFIGLSNQQVVVSVRWLDGTSSESILSGGDPRLVLGRESSPLGWFALGVEHVLTGLDHLAFVIGLLLVTGFQRRIVLTITAFTLAHSLTLALAVLDVIRVPGAPVEATIAASILLVARESTHAEPTLTRRFPWAVALIFGLIHGLGFAGALQEIGLPHGSIAGALFLFNCGVEVGQLGVVGVSLLLAKVAPRPLRSPRLVAYGIGAPAAYWLLTRSIGLLTV